VAGAGEVAEAMPRAGEAGEAEEAAVVAPLVSLDLEAHPQADRQGILADPTRTIWEAHQTGAVQEWAGSVL